MIALSESLLKVESLEVYIGFLHILRGIDLEINRGEIVCLLGRNGAGKTTTIKAIIGLRKTARGRIMFDGIDITHLPPEKRVLMGIGYQPEDVKIFPDLTVKENIDIPLIVRHVRDRNRVYETIYKIFPEVKDLLHRRGSQLSGGQRKMVAIARALAYDPKIVLLDEPFEGLAPIVVNRIFKAFQDMRKEGISILYAESNIRTINIADKVYIIERGEIMFHGTPEEIMSNEQILKIVGR
ncbi:MAG: ABC transporter ATP-binding protein [Sulfolobales archaeon]